MPEICVQAETISIIVGEGTKLGINKDFWGGGTGYDWNRKKDRSLVSCFLSQEIGPFLKS